MKRFLLLLALFLFCSLSWAQVHVRGYYRKNGTYVQPHERTHPNHTVTDNYSFPGNYNPNTGKITGGTSGTGGTVRSSSSHLLESPPSPNYSSTPTPYLDPMPVRQTNSSKSSESSAIISDNLYAEMEPNAALRKKPSYLANSIYAIPKGATVKITNYNENYYLAEVDGRNGYVCTCQVKKTFNSH